MGRRLGWLSVARPANGYDAFISYSHRDDDALAATLQAGLESFATPWYRSRALRVFRDTTDLAATPGLLSSIFSALGTSRWFVLVASEHAAHSGWVNEEVSWWLANRDRDRFLIALSSGQIHWAGRDFDWGYTNALPPALIGAFAEEPGWIDLREVKETLANGGGARSVTGLRRLTRRGARRQVGDWVAGLAAPIRGTAKDSLVGAHLRYRKRTRRTVQTVLAAMVTLTVTATAAAAVAVNQLAQARLQTRIATSRELAALSGNLLTRHLDLAELFAVEAYALDPSPQALSALFQSVTASPHLVTYLPAGGQVTAIAGSDDGRVIVAGRSDGTVLRWSLPDIRPAVIARMGTAVTSVSVDRHGTAAAALSQTAALRWDAVAGGRLLRVPAGQRAIGIGISASGRFTALASTAKGTAGDGSGLTLYGQRANTIKTARTEITPAGPQDIAFSGDSQLVAVDSVIGAWSRLSAPDLKLLGGDAPGVFRNENTTTMSPSGNFIASSGQGNTFNVWEIRQGAVTPVQDPWNVPVLGANPSAVAINAPGTRVAQADDGTIYVSGNPRSRTSSTSFSLTGNGAINNGALAFAGRSTLVSASDDLLTLWDLRQYSRVATETSITAPFSCAACGGPLLAMPPDGQRVAVVADNGNIMAEQDLPSGRSLVTRPGGDDYGQPLWIQGSRRLLVPTADAGAQIWSIGRRLVRSGSWRTNPTARKMMLHQQFGHVGLPVAASVRPGGRQVVEVDSSGDILVRNAATGQINRLIEPSSALTEAGLYIPVSAAVDAAGQAAAIVAPHGVVVTSITTGRSRILPGDSSDKVAFDGEKLLIQQPDGSLQVWNADGSRLIKVIAAMAGTISGPVAGENGLAAETGSDGSAVVIDLNSGVTLGTIYPPKGTWDYSTSISMPTTGTSLITVSEGGIMGGPGELTDWQLSVRAWLKAACASAGHALTAAQWQEYVGGSPPAQLACAAHAG